MFILQSSIVWVKNKIKLIFPAKTGYSPNGQSTL